MNKSIFNDNTLWSIAEYEIKEEDGLEFIVIKRGVKTTYYDPLSTEIQWRRPKGDDVEAHSNAAPHVALAQMNPDDYEDILKFVNNWGLLGLKEEYESGFQLSTILNMPPYADTLQNLNALFKNLKRAPGERDREPVIVFQHAVREYQKILDRLLPYMNYVVPNEFGSKREKKKLADKNLTDQENKGTHSKRELDKINLLLEENTNATVPFLDLNQKIRKSLSPQFYWNTAESDITLGWHFSSLLSAIYMRVALDFKAGKPFIKCRWRGCQKLFIPQKPNNQFCHDRCRNSHNIREYHLRLWLNKALLEFNYLPKIGVEELFNEVIEDGYSGEKKVLNEMRSRLEVRKMN